MFIKTILYVECSNDGRALLEQWQKSLFGVEVIYASSIYEARHVIEDNPIDLIILDYCFEDGTGVQLCRELRERQINIPVVFFSVIARDIDKQMALEAGCTAYLSKPEEAHKLGPLLYKTLDIMDLASPQGNSSGNAWI